MMRSGRRYYVVIPPQDGIGAVAPIQPIVEDPFSFLLSIDPAPDMAFKFPAWDHDWDEDLDNGIRLYTCEEYVTQFGPGDVGRTGRGGAETKPARQRDANLRRPVAGIQQDIIVRASAVNTGTRVRIGGRLY